MYTYRQKLSKILLILLTVNLRNTTTFVFGNNNQNDMFFTNNSIPKHINTIPYDGIIVKYKKQQVNLGNFVGYMSANTFAKSKKLKIKQNEKKLNISLLESVNGNSDLDTLLNDVKADISVEYVQPNYIYQSLDLSNQNDTYKNNLWGLYNNGQNIQGQIGFSGSDISWDEAIQVFSGSNNISDTGVIVAVLDTGIAYNHPDLINNMWDGSNCKDHEGNFLGGCVHGYDYDNNDKDPIILNTTHGTHVAGILAASVNNSQGVIGINPKVKIMALKDENFTTLGIVNSINFAKYNEAKIINASFGGYNWIDKLMYDTIKNFGDNGGLFIAAAGNSGKNHDLGQTDRMFPAGFGVDNTLSGKTFTGLINIISVAATDNQDNLASFSDYGNSSVNIGAPGVNIYSTIQGTGKIISFSESFSGTYATGSTYSFSTGGLKNNFGANYGLLGIWGDVNYPFSTGSNTSYIEKQIDISALKIPMLHFNAWCDAGKGNQSSYTDYMQLSFSTGGAFINIDKIDYFNQKLNFIENFQGSTGAIGNLSYDLSNYISPNFKLRFTWVTDSIQTTDLGCIIFGNINYPIEVVGFDDGSNESYGYMDGTSMATPYIAGLASLAWSYRPDLNFTDIKNAILQNGDTINSLSGKTTSGKRINAYKTLLSLVPPDIIPDQFTFTDLTGQLFNTLIESNSLIITGINTGALISITGGEYKIGTGSYTTSTGFIYSGDTITVRNTTSSSELTSMNTILNIGGITDIFTSTTRLTPDAVPDQFTFTDLTGQLLNTLIESNSLIITGMNTGALISITGGEYKIGTGSYTTSTGLIYSGDSLQIKHITSKYNVTYTNTTLNIGGISDIFTTQTYVETIQVIADNSNSGVTLTGGINVGSGFSYIGEIVPNNIYSFTGGQVSDFLTGSIFESSGSALVEILVESGTHFYTSTGSIKFEKKNILGEESINGNIKQIFTGAIQIGSNETILLDTPGVIKYLSDKNATKMAYKKTGAIKWNIINIELNECNVDLSTKPICSYKIGSTIYIKTYHFTDFAFVKEETIPPIVLTPPSSGGGGGGGGGSTITSVTFIKDICPNGDYSSNLYDKICGTKPIEKTQERIIDNKKDNNVVALKQIHYSIKKIKYLDYELININGYKMSNQIMKINIFIINNKKIYQKDKKNYIERFNKFLLAKYYLNTTKNPSRGLKSKYSKEVILLKSVIKKLLK